MNIPANKIDTDWETRALLAEAALEKVREDLATRPRHLTEGHRALEAANATLAEQLQIESDAKNKALDKLGKAGRYHVILQAQVERLFEARNAEKILREKAEAELEDRSTNWRKGDCTPHPVRPAAHPWKGLIWKTAGKNCEECGWPQDCCCCEPVTHPDNPTGVHRCGECGGDHEPSGSRSDCIICWKRGANAATSELEKARAAIEHYKEDVATSYEQQGQLAERLAKAEAACAEIKSLIPDLWFYSSDDGPFSQAQIDHALSTDCGKGWLSSEKAKELEADGQNVHAKVRELTAQNALLVAVLEKARRLSSDPSDLYAILRIQSEARGVIAQVKGQTK
jgi:hypothetical protein